MLKRLFDIFFSLLGLIILSPLLLLIALVVLFDSPGGVIFRQKRVGKNMRDFMLYKFRSMKQAKQQQSLITIGNRDSRITRTGYYLRKYKLDELPQLFNILMGDMSLVGPRPEVHKYVELYSKDQLKVLSVKPGLTDYASIEYINESEILKQSDDPEKTYVEVIMPAKLELNKKYIREQSFTTDLKIIGRTLIQIL